MSVRARSRGLEEQKLWKREVKDSHLETQCWPWTRKHSLISPTTTKIWYILHQRSLLLSFPQVIVELDCSTLYSIAKQNKMLKNLEISSYNFYFLCSSLFSFFLTLIIRKHFICLWNFNFMSCEEFFSLHKLWIIAPVNQGFSIPAWLSGIILCWCPVGDVKPHLFPLSPVP